MQKIVAMKYKHSTDTILIHIIDGYTFSCIVRNHTIDTLLTHAITLRHRANTIVRHQYAAIVARSTLHLDRSSSLSLILPLFISQCNRNTRPTTPTLLNNSTAFINNVNSSNNNTRKCSYPPRYTNNHTICLRVLNRCQMSTLNNVCCLDLRFEFL